MSTNFETKRTTSNFWAQICRKIDLGVEILKIQVWIRNQHLQFNIVPIFSQNGQLLVFWPKFGEVAQLRATFWFKYCRG